MAGPIKIKIEGLEPLLARLKGLPPRVQKKVLRPLIARAGTKVLKAARARVPVDQGWLKKSLGSRVQVYRRSGVILAVVGPRTGYQKIRRKKRGRLKRLLLGKAPGRKLTAFGKKLMENTRQRPTKYAHLVEYGHGGPRPAPPHPFMRPAWDLMRNEIRILLEVGIAKGIVEAARAP